MTTQRLLAAVYLLAVFLAIYGPAAGQGLIADDYGWIVHGLSAVDGDVIDPFRHNVGFYRPLVTLSFAMNYALFELEPKPYGITNILLTLGCAALLVWLVRLHRLSFGFAVFAAALWLFNFHGINIALLWTSGRTALLLTVFALGAAIAFLKERTILAGLLSLMAMFSKEEAVALPVLFSCWVAMEGARSGRQRSRVRSLFWKTAPVWAAVAIYAALRLQSGAIGPTNAPPYYALSVQPALLARNIREYADRACTLSAVALAAIWICVRARPSLRMNERVAVSRAVVWLVAGFGLTVFLPIRSSLYAVFPSIGSALAASSLASAWWRQLSKRARTGLIAAGLVFPLALFPVYRSRNQSWVANARLSNRVLKQLIEMSRSSTSHTFILIDEQSSRTNLHNAFGSALSVIPRLISERPLTLWVEPPAPGIELAGIKAPERDAQTVVLRLVDSSGNLAPVAQDEAMTK